MDFNSNANNVNLDELNAEIMRLRGEIDAKMDNYFINEDTDIYATMKKYDLSKQNTASFKAK